MPDRPRYEAEEIKRAVGSEEFARLLESFGAKVNRSRRRANCPVHGGDNPEALHYDEKPEGVLWNCFSGDHGGDVIALAQGARGGDFGDALEWLGTWAGIAPRGPRRAVQIGRRSEGTGSPPEAPRRADRMAALLTAFAKRSAPDEAYLAGRGIAFREGLCFFNVGGTGDEEADALARDGYRIAAPLYSARGGELISFQFRRVTDPGDKRPKKMNLSGPLGDAVFGAPGIVDRLRLEEPVLVCEGLTDTLAALSAGGIKTGEADGEAKLLRVVGFPGVGSARKLRAVFGDAPLIGRDVLIALDNDSKGEEAARELARDLHAAGATPYRVRTAGKDLAEDFREGIETGEPPEAVLLRLFDAAILAGRYDPDAPDAVAEWGRALEEWKEGFDRTGLSTGLPALDEILGGGWRESRLYVLAGHTGEGKSAFALRVAHEAAKAWTPVLFVSYELEDLELRARLVAPITGTFYGRLLAPDALSKDERKRIEGVWTRYAAGIGTRIFFRVPGASEAAGKGPRPGSVEWIREQAEQVARLYNRPPLVVVDYLQSAAAFSEDAGDDGSNRRVAVGRTSLGLRDIARSVGCPVLVLSSIPRTAYLRSRDEYRLPEIGDLKESGEIEFNADGVLYLWPERRDWEAHEKKGEERDRVAPRPLLLRAVKGRHFGSGSVLLTWNPPLGTFEQGSAAGVAGVTPETVCSLAWRPDLRPHAHVLPDGSRAFPKDAFRKFLQEETGTTYGEAGAVLAAWEGKLWRTEGDSLAFPPLTKPPEGEPS